MLEVLPTLGARFHAVITDPPYHLASIVKRFGADGAAAAKVGATGAYARASKGFMGKQWDGGDIAFRPDTWAAVGSVMLPGAHLVAFAGTKGAHRMACAIEDAGFEIRDDILSLIASDTFVQRFMESLTEEQALAFLNCIEQSPFGGMLGRLFWAYGTGFPKSHDAAKAIDKHLGVSGQTVPQGAPVKRMIPGADQHKTGWEKNNGREYQPGSYMPGSEEAAQWEGWGTALKPAYEPIVLARWPMDRKTVAANVLAHGTGAINVDACRVGTEGGTAKGSKPVGNGHGIYGAGLHGACEIKDIGAGRFPANVVHDGSEEVIAAFPGSAGASGKASGASLRGQNESVARGRFNGLPDGQEPAFYGDAGSAARFFYSSKADADDRLGSKHPTVKPVGLMRWLVRLVTPKGGMVLDPFAGSGTTGMACMAEGFDCHLIEREAEYAADIRRRIAHVSGADAPLFASAE